MPSALDVAKYFICRIDREAGDTISALKLQKLVYYAQAWSLVLQDLPLFPEQIQAWPHGPVVYDVWNSYRDYKHTAIPEPETYDLDFSEDEIEVLEEVWNAYGELGARQLEKLTHDEHPWVQARKGLDPGEKSQEVISHETMKSYYEKYLVED
ncbi:Panacea domain-containing protein [Nostoc sp.]|uniref:Panacea domain-containing protein n=1 Tax=Nostoc sp. TaxID=1180 RepID=UPI002FF86834